MNHANINQIKKLLKLICEYCFNVITKLARNELFHNKRKIILATRNLRINSISEPSIKDRANTKNNENPLSKARA